MEPSNRDEAARQTESRKREHVEFCLSRDVRFQSVSNGLERYRFEHNALPELNADEVDCTTMVFGKPLSFPLLITGMTGGYDEAESINGILAEMCQRHGLALGSGSQRQMLESDRHVASFRVLRQRAPAIPLLANIGAVEVARMRDDRPLRRIIDALEADALAIHLNPLQELVQPEGSPTFRGVLDAIAGVVRRIPVPVVVKEVGAGLSVDVVRRLVEVGVTWVDLAGAGGTSWAGVELLRAKGEPGRQSPFWDWGIPLARILEQLQEVTWTPPHCIASGGISSGRDIAVSLALGAALAGSARPILQALRYAPATLDTLLEQWKNDLRSIMFLTGSRTIADLRQVPLFLV